MTTYQKLNATTRALASAGDLAAAIRMLDEDRASVPRRIGLTYLMEAELLVSAGKGPAAIETLERALARGCRYRKEWLLDNKTLAPIRELPALRDFADRAQRAYDAASAAAKPTLMFAMPDTLPDAFGYPLLMVLHGNNSNAKETAPQWSAMADRGWVVAVPQSSELGMSPDAYTWNDRERTANELDLHLDRVKRATQVDTSRIVLAGFSMGATQALALALTKRFMVRGVIAVAAWLQTITEFAALIEGGAARMLRAYVVVGSEDPSRDGARALVDVMTRNRIKATLDERAGLDHDYPADMDATLVTALDFATK